MSEKLGGEVGDCLATSIKEIKSVHQCTRLEEDEDEGEFSARSPNLEAEGVPIPEIYSRAEEKFSIYSITKGCTIVDCLL